MFAEHYGVEPAEMAPGIYRSMTGNRALAWGLLAAAERTQVPVVFGAYPITPASDILHELALHKRFRIRTFQAEDEIAAVTAAISSSAWIVRTRNRLWIASSSRMLLAGVIGYAPNTTGICVRSAAARSPQARARLPVMLR